MIASKARCGPIPLRLAYGVLRGIRPSLAEEALGRMGFSRCARGALVIASKACCGPIPLRLAYGALRGNGPALAEEALGRMGLSRYARGAWVIASKARYGPIPLRLAYGALRGNGPACAEEALGRMGFSRVARRGFCCSPPRLAADRSRSAWRMGRSAGTVLRAHTRRKAQVKVRRSECPRGHRIPARGETPGMAHKRCVLKERRIPPDRPEAWS